MKTVATQLQATQAQVARTLKETFSLTFDASTVIADIINEDQKKVLSALIQFFAENPTDATTILGTLIRKIAELSNAKNQPVTEEGSQNAAALREELAQKTEELSTLKLELEKKQQELAEAQRAAKLAEIASGNIIGLREDFATRMSLLAQDLNKAVIKLRDQEGDGALAAHLEFADIEEIDNQCLRIFNSLNADVLGRLPLYRTMLSEYTQLGQDFQEADKIPSKDLYKRFSVFLGIMQSLQSRQEELILEQMGTDNLTIPNDWLENGKLIDFYKILEVSPTATQEEIKKAYRSQSKKHHPDHSQTETDDESKRINLANEVLSNAEQRALYDQARTFF